MNILLNNSCYLCGSTFCTKIHDTIRYNLSPRPYRCDNCGFTFLYPKMSEEEEHSFYEQDYRFVYVEQSPEDLWNESLPEARERVNRFQDLLRNDCNILEIGCASGFFLSEVENHVNSATGVELTKEYVRFAVSKGLDVRDSLNMVEDNSYDLIFMFHVLEHINDPIKFLKEVKNKLSPNGKLIIEVPNVDDILVSKYKIAKHLDFYWEIAHHYYFSRNSLGKVLQRAGYHYEIFPLQRYDLSNHIYWMLKGEPGGQGYYGDVFTETLLQEYRKTLEKQYLCDTIYAIGNGY